MQWEAAVEDALTYAASGSDRPRKGSASSSSSAAAAAMGRLRINAKLCRDKAAEAARCLPGDPAAAAWHALATASFDHDPGNKPFALSAVSHELRRAPTMKDQATFFS